MAQSGGIELASVQQGQTPSGARTPHHWSAYRGGQTPSAARTPHGLSSRSSVLQYLDISGAQSVDSLVSVDPLRRPSYATSIYSGRDGAGAGGETDQEANAEQKKKPGKGWRFWAILLALCVTSLASAMEATVTSTALPTIAANLNVGSEFIWVPNAYLLTSTVCQPLIGQTADIFGRRWLTISSVAIFAIGSGLCGGANGSVLLIVGRAFQGWGGGGINILLDLIICDLIPMRERGKYLGLIFIVFFVGTGIGPYIGGVLVKHHWRWVFYLNLPIAGAALIMLYLFLHVKYKKAPTMEKLKRIDYFGNALLTCSVIAILIALSYGGAIYAWSSWHIILPLALGFVGMIVFHFYQATKWCREPTMPPRLFTTRTSVAAFFVTFLHGLLVVWQIYFLPLYFQAVQGSTPARSGVQLLPTVIVLVPSAAIGGVLMTKTGRYRPFQMVGFGLILIGFGLNTLLDATSSVAEWVGYQVIVALGAGIMLPVLLPAVQVELAEADVAVATGTWAFLRSFGAIWGVSIPGAVFNNRFNEYLSSVDDPRAQELLGGGQAYEHVSRVLVNSFPEPARSQIIYAYTQAMKQIWLVALAFAGLAFVVVFFEKELKMRTELDTEFGIDDDPEDKKKPVVTPTPVEPPVISTPIEAPIKSELDLAKSREYAQYFPKSGQLQPIEEAETPRRIKTAVTSRHLRPSANSTPIETSVVSTSVEPPVIATPDFATSQELASYFPQSGQVTPSTGASSPRRFRVSVTPRRFRTSVTPEQVEISQTPKRVEIS